MKCKSIFGFLILASSACDSSSSSDPATLTRDALNPPSGLVSVTWDKKIELRWQAMNAEEDFKGFRVFAVAKSLSALPAPAYPTGYSIDKLNSGSVPRCDLNSSLFEAFGFPAIEKGDKDCKGDETSDNPSASSGASLTDQGHAAHDKDSESLPPQIIKCHDKDGKDLSNEHLSLPLTSPSLTEQVCYVKALADGTELSAGTTYSFFVAAITANDAFDKVNVSWTSNFVEDTPSTPIFNGEITLDKDEMKYLPLSSIIKKIPFTELGSAKCSDATDNTGCRVYKENARTPEGIYFGRLGTGTYPQRTFISATAGESLAILLRGPQTLDPRSPADIAESIPGDQAISKSTTNVTYDKTGKPQPIYGNQVFDFSVVIDSQTHYGKILVKTLSLSTTTDAASAITLKVKALLQAAPNNTHYLTR